MKPWDEKSEYFEFKSIKDRDKWIIWMKTELIPHIEQQERKLVAKKFVREKVDCDAYCPDFDNENEECTCCRQWINQAIEETNAIANQIMEE